MNAKVEKEIEIRPMTMVEYDKLRDFVDELETKNYSEEKQTRKIAMFVCETVAGMDLNNKSATIKTVLDVYEKIMKATNDEQEAEAKN